MLCLGGISAPGALAQEMKAMPAIAVEEAPLPVPQAGLVMLELFTTESCPFCPQAERNFNDMIQGDQVIGYTCRVDYFESGATNPYAREFCTAQQDLYVQMLRTGSRFTPQLVVNGMQQIPGQNLQKAIQAIQAVRSAQAPVQPITFSTDRLSEGAVDVILPDLARKEDDQKFVLRLITMERTAKENAVPRRRQDQPLMHIATSLYEGGLWDGKKTIWPATPPIPEGSDLVIAFVQERHSGRILAAGQIVLPAAPPQGQ